jgi:RNA polymerase sigma-70 factor (ECF subfamily)
MLTELVGWAGRGCAAAIEQLVGRYETRVFRLVRNITGNHEDAEEVAQNAFFKAFLNWSIRLFSG